MGFSTGFFMISPISFYGRDMPGIRKICKNHGTIMGTMISNGGSDLEPWVFIFPKKKGERRSYLECANHMID